MDKLLKDAKNIQDQEAARNNQAIALGIAAEKGFIHIIQLLLSHGVPCDAVSKKNRQGRGALHLAAINQQVTAVNILLNSGADMYKFNFYGHTAMHEASSRGFAAVVQAFLDAGIDVHHETQNNEISLIMAAGEGHLEVVRMLLAMGSPVNHVAYGGVTALTRAAHFGHTEVVRTLIEAGQIKFLYIYICLYFLPRGCLIFMKLMGCLSRGACPVTTKIYPRVPIPKLRPLSTGKGHCSIHPSHLNVFNLI